MDLWEQYNTQEDIEPFMLAKKLVTKTPVENTNHIKYEKELAIQQCSYSIQQYLHHLDPDFQKFQKYVANFPNFDAEYCESRCNEKISTILRWNYCLVLYFTKRGTWLKKAIYHMIESSKLQKNEAFVVFYLTIAFNLNKLYRCKMDVVITKTAIWFVRERQCGKIIRRCISIVSSLESSTTIKQEMLNVVLKCAEKSDYPKFEMFLKSAIEIAVDKKPIRNKLANRFEKFADEQTKPLLKTIHYANAQKYFVDKKDKDRVADKTRTAAKDITFSKISVNGEIKKIEICGENNFKRLKYLIKAFKSSIPKIEKIRLDVESEKPSLGSMFSELEITDAGMPIIRDDSKIKTGNREYEKDFVEYINYIAITLSISIRNFEKERKITVDDYIFHLKSFGLHQQSVMSLIEYGIQRHYAQDYISSIHILIPQIENTLRTILEQKGVGIVKMKKNGMMYSTLFELIKNGYEILGTDLAELLKLKFADPKFSNLRNKICHSTYEDFSKIDDFKPLHDFSHETSLLVILCIMVLTELSIIPEK